MTFPTQLQTFQGGNTYQNLVASNCMPSWNNGYIYITGGQSGWSTMTKVNILGGTELDYSDLSLLNDAPLNVSVGTGYYWAIDWDDQLYCRSGLGMSRIDPTDWTRHDTWGALSYGIFPPPLPDCTGSNDALGGPIIVYRNSNGTKYWQGAGVGGFGFHGADTYLQNGNEFAGLHLIGYDPGNHSGCIGVDGSGDGYYGTYSNNSGPPALIYKIHCDDSAWVPADWPTVNPGVSYPVLASIDPTDIDSGWIGIGIVGMALDKSDNNLVVIFGGDTGERYITKINSTSGVIMWSTQTNNNVSPGWHMQFSNIRGRYYVGVNGHIYGYDTSDGSLIIDQTTGIEGTQFSGQQMYDDTTGVIIGNMNQQFLGGDSPEILNTTPPISYNSVAWMALYVATPIIPPVSPTRRWGVFCRPEPR